MDELKSGNFGLKMRVYFLQKRMQKMSPDGMHEMLNENAEFKIMVETLQRDMEQYRTEYGDLAAQYDDRVSVLEHLTALCEDLQAENRALKKQMFELQSADAMAQQNLHVAREDLEFANSLVEEKDQVIKRLGAERGRSGGEDDVVIKLFGDGKEVLTGRFNCEDAGARLSRSMDGLSASVPDTEMVHTDNLFTGGPKPALLHVERHLRVAIYDKSLLQSSLKVLSNAIEVSTPPSPGLTPSQSSLKRTRAEDTNEVESLVLTPPPSSSPSPSPSRTPGKRIPAKKLAAEVEVIPPKRLYPTLDEKYGRQAAAAGDGSEGDSKSNPVEDGTNAAGTLYPSLADSTPTENPITVSDNNSLRESTKTAAAAATSEAGTPVVNSTTDVSAEDAQEAYTYSCIVITATTLDVSGEIHHGAKRCQHHGSERDRRPFWMTTQSLKQIVTLGQVRRKELHTPSIIITDTTLEVSDSLLRLQAVAAFRRWRK
ncbi:hypothetical protein HDV00_010794 [Rhizophlyctis rosea]|nr:hypothetical protein HDV00_010794 [Rhizophlyctis rosea]